MKSIFLLYVELIALGSNIFCQCPPSGLKIQTPVCDSPANLQANAINCSKLDVKWIGNKDQTYIVEATYADPATNNIIKENGRNISCDDNGNCSATIAVKEGAEVNWTVQSICSIEGVTFYSYKVDGNETLIPYCQPVTGGERKGISNEKIRVYPNPTAGLLMVDYRAELAGNAECIIFDMSGKQVFRKSIGVLSKTVTRYTLDLHNLISGVYILELRNGQDISSARFVLFNQ